MLAGMFVIASGIAVSVVAILGRAGKLPRNHFVGIRLPSTLRSDEAWLAAHRASWPYSFGAGAVTLIYGVRLALEPEDDSLVVPFLVVLLVTLLAGAVVAHRAARNADS